MLIPTVLLTAAGGLAVVLLCPLSQIAWRFVRLLGTLAFGGYAAVAVWLIIRVAWWEQLLTRIVLIAVVVGGVSAVVTMTLAVLLDSKRPRVVHGLRGALGVGAIAGLLGAFAWMAHLSHPPTAPWWVSTPGYLFSAFYLGSVTVAWLLGHRYLTATEMTIDPLRRATRLLLIALGARWIYLLAVLLLAAVPLQSAGAAPTLGSITADWLMVSIRVGVGLLLPSVFAVMAWQCVQLRSTQSATGILFFMSIFVVIGELSSRYLAGQVGVPL